MTAPVFKQITIIGVGLIGGSIARAALEKGAAGEVVLFDGNADALKRAGEIGFGRPAASIEDAVRDADAVFHCVPVGAISATAKASIGAMKSGAILIDNTTASAEVARELANRGAEVIAFPVAGCNPELVAARPTAERGWEVHVVRHGPVKALEAVVASTGAELLVVGNRGMTGAGRLLGSVPNKISHDAPCNLLIVQTS